MCNLKHKVFNMNAKGNILIFCVVLNFIFSCTSTKTITQPTTVTPSEKTETSNVNESKDTDQISVSSIYRASKTKVFDLIHTKLEVSFDWENRYLLGKATVQLKPHFYPQSFVILDAKGFDIHKVEKIEGSEMTPLFYKYDGSKLKIDLGKLLTKEESITLLIDYTAKPYELTEIEGNSAITENRGLYFINHDGSDPSKPQQIWTQGETESNSCWFPTIDAPNQKSTEEIYITVDNKFKTLSNGELIYSQINSDSTRTDYWKLDKPHAPYLFMLAVGDFAVVEDSWNGIPVNYYVEPKYEPYARDIFGNTPEMMTYFSELLNYPYVWPKYSQIAVRDYVSGAMENTTATVFMEDVQMTSRELLDGDYEDVIAHELFHHWFGDLVTCESWSNLTLNEGFASYSEYLWTEHKKGKAEAEYKLYTELETYLSEAENKEVDLIRYHYNDRDDMFDSHSYSKGGLILHMLREYVGDEAFFAALNLYLKKHAFGTVEAADLRLAMEEVTGEDLNWFFNEWFYAKGHPKFKVNESYNDSTDVLSLNVWQQQDSTQIPIYKIPVNIQIFNENKIIDSTIWVDQYHNVYNFSFDKKPSLVLFNSEENIVAEVDQEKTEDEWIVQAKQADNVVARTEAFKYLYDDSTSTVYDVFYHGLDDPFEEVVKLCISYASEYNDSLVNAWEDKILSLAKNAKDTDVRSDAIYALFEAFGDKYTDLYKNELNDSSYLVAGTALYAILQLPNEDNDQLIKSFLNDENVNIVLPLASYFVMSRDSTKFDWFVKQMNNGASESQYYLVRMFGQYMLSLDSAEINQGINVLSGIALNDSRYYIRIAALQSLQLFEDNLLVKEKLVMIREQEKDDRVRRFLN